MKILVFCLVMLSAASAFATGHCNSFIQSHSQAVVSNYVAPVVAPIIAAQPVLQVVTPYTANLQPVYVAPQQQLNYGHAQNVVNTIVQREVVKVQNNNKLRDKLNVRNILKNRQANKAVKQNVKVIERVQVNSY